MSARQDFVDHQLIPVFCSASCYCVLRILFCKEEGCKIVADADNAVHECSKARSKLGFK